jgi:shikimate kinase
MRNIVLTGFMGTGKTAAGKELSRILSMRLIDIDHEIEQAEAMPIKEIFTKKGEAYFREIEAEMIRKYSAEKKVIIATGGGAVLREENLSALRENGTIFCLTARPETIHDRTSINHDRPLLKGDDRMEKIISLLSSRSPVYEQAGIMIDTENKTPLQIAEEIIRIASR